MRHFSFAANSQLKSIGYDAFYNCVSLTSIEIPSSVTSIGDSAFYGCSSLTKVNYLGTIDQWTQIYFGGWSSNPLYYAENLYINDQLVTEAKLTTATKISAYAFYNCSSLTSIVIPDSVTSIGDYAFFQCSNLTTINFADTEEEWMAIPKGSYWDYKTGNYTIVYNYVAE